MKKAFGLETLQFEESPIEVLILKTLFQYCSWLARQATKTPPLRTYSQKVYFLRYLSFSGNRSEVYGPLVETDTVLFVRGIKLKKTRREKNKIFSSLLKLIHEQRCGRTIFSVADVHCEIFQCVHPQQLTKVIFFIPGTNFEE